MQALPSLVHLQVQLRLTLEAESVGPQESKWLTARRGQRSRYLLVDPLPCQTLLLWWVLGKMQTCLHAVFTRRQQAFT